MACRYCEESWFFAKLGRCRQCMGLCVLLLVVLGLLNLYLPVGQAVYKVALQLSWLAVAILSLGHLVMALYYWLSERNDKG